VSLPFTQHSGKGGNWGSLSDASLRPCPSSMLPFMNWLEWETRKANVPDGPFFGAEEATHSHASSVCFGHRLCHQRPTSQKEEEEHSLSMPLLPMGMEAGTHPTCVPGSSVPSYFVVIFHNKNLPSNHSTRGKKSFWGHMSRRPLLRLAKGKELTAMTAALRKMSNNNNNNNNIGIANTTSMTFDGIPFHETSQDGSHPVAKDRSQFLCSICNRGCCHCCCCHHCCRCRRFSSWKSFGNFWMIVTTAKGSQNSQQEQTQPPISRATCV